LWLSLYFQDVRDFVAGVIEDMKLNYCWILYAMKYKKNQQECHHCDKMRAYDCPFPLMHLTQTNHLL